MNQDMSNAPTLTPQQPKRSNTTVILIIVVLVLCCLCAVAAGAAWQFGDQVMEMLGVTI